jgi:hypothetical protein
VPTPVHQEEVQTSITTSTTAGLWYIIEHSGLPFEIWWTLKSYVMHWGALQ